MSTQDSSSMFRAARLCCAVLCACWYSANAFAQCPLTQESTFAHAEIGDVRIFRDAATHAVAFASQMQVNTDGAPDSYHPDDIGITHICNGISIGFALYLILVQNCFPVTIMFIY